MRTGASGVLALAAVLTATSALTAQDYEWRGDRPDGYAPIGVWNDYVLSEGQVQFGYRLGVDNLDGLKAGEFEVGVLDDPNRRPVPDMGAPTEFVPCGQRGCLPLPASPRAYAHPLDDGRCKRASQKESLPLVAQTPRLRQPELPAPPVLVHRRPELGRLARSAIEIDQRREAATFTPGIDAPSRGRADKEDTSLAGRTGHGWRG